MLVDNQLKYENYKEQSKRLKRALDNDFNLEFFTKKQELNVIKITFVDRRFRLGRIW